MVGQQPGLAAGRTDGGPGEPRTPEPVQDARLLAASREALVAALLRDLAVAYREAMWPALVGPGDARQRLDRALDALFGVIDAHLPLLLASDQVFHRANAASINFNEPFARLFEDGIADGSLAPPGGDPAEAAELLFNTVCWSYVHLRGRHRWPAERARHGLRRLMTPGLVTVPGPGKRPAGS